ncbi:MAG: NAD(P)-dependent oxidoreductase [Microthrixaceae bacterium]
MLANKGFVWLSAAERDPDVEVPIDTTAVGNRHKRVGLVGASHVGRLTRELLAAHELEVAFADPYLSAAEAASMGAGKMDLDELCAWCDVLSLHAPEVDSTRGMIGAAQLSLLHDGATVVNTARGALIDTDALLGELASGRLQAILDVTHPEPLAADSALRRLPNVLLTPHIAGAVGSETERLADLAITEVQRFVAGEPPLHPVLRSDMARIA